MKQQTVYASEKLKIDNTMSFAFSFLYCLI